MNNRLILAASAALACSLTATAEAAEAGAAYDFAYVDTYGAFANAYRSATAIDADKFISGLGTFDLRYGDSTGTGTEPWHIRFMPGRDFFTAGSAFYLGSLIAYNGSVLTTTALNGLDLDFSSFVYGCNGSANLEGLGDCQLINTGEARYRLTIVSTVNRADATPEENADAIGIADLGLAANILEGQEAEFYLFGTINSPLTLTDLQSRDTTIGIVKPFTDPGFEQIKVSPVPEPATWAMMISGFGMLGAATRRRRKLIVTFA